MALRLTHPEAKEIIRIAFAVDERPDGKGPIPYTELRGLIVQLAAWVETRYGRLKFPSQDGSQPQNNVVAHQCFRKDPDWMCWWGEDSHDGTAATRFRVRFRSRPTLLMGFRDGVTFMDHAGLWPAAETGNIATWAREMRARHFYGAPVERYESAMRSALKEVRRGLGVPPDGDELTREPLRSSVIRQAVGLEPVSDDPERSPVGGLAPSEEDGAGHEPVHVAGTDGAITETDRKRANLDRLARAVQSLHEDIIAAAPETANRISIALGQGPIAVGIAHVIEAARDAARAAQGLPVPARVPVEVPDSFMTSWLRWRASFRDFADASSAGLLGSGVDATVDAYDRELRDWHVRTRALGISPAEPLPAAPTPPSSGGSSWLAVPVLVGLGAAGTALALWKLQSSKPTPKPGAPPEAAL